MTKLPEKEIVKRIAKEFLEYRLGIEASPKNIRRLSAHIIQFEKEAEKQTLKKDPINIPLLKSLIKLNISKQMHLC